MKILDASPVWGKRYKLFIVLTIVACSLALTSAPPWGAFAQEQQQQTKPPQAQPQPAQDQQAATQAIPVINLVPVPLEGAVERAEKDGTALHLSLRDTIKLALQANLDIAIAETREDSLQWALTSAKTVYQPTLNAITFSWQDSKSLNRQSYDASASLVNSSLNHNWGTGIAQNIPTGGNFSFTISGSRADSNQVSLLSNTSYGASWRLSFTQPLLQNFKIDQNRNRIRLANLSLKANDTQFKSQVSTTVRDVENAYWRLVQAIESYKISVASVKQARLTVETNIKKRDIGTIPPIDVITSQAQQARQEVALMQAEDSVQQAENSLRTLITKDRSSDVWGQTIVPTDLPDVSEFKIDLNTAIETALKNSPQLDNYDVQLQQADYQLEMDRNSRKWALSVTGQMNGSSTSVPEGNKNYPAKLWGGLGTSYLYMFNIIPPSWTVSMNLQIPLFHTANDAQIASDRIARNQTVMNRIKQEQSIVTSVRNALQQLTSARKQIDTAEIGALAAQVGLDATGKRVDAGLATNLELLTSQDNLNNAKNQLLNAKITYRQAILNLQQAMFTLLEANKIDTGDIAKSNKLTFK